jgi:predicted dehydrogenase
MRVENPPLTAEPLRVGVIGLGHAGVSHIEAFNSNPRSFLVAIAGNEPERLGALSKQYNIGSIASDWETIVARDDLDVISIATPNVLHHTIAIAALNSGKHVFCEKPLALNGQQSREMVEAAKSNNRILEVDFNHRRRSDIQFARSWLESEGIGRIYHSRASWKRRAGIPGIDSWFTSKESAGGGALIDLGSHIIDSLLFMLGEPRVLAVSAVTHGELGRAGYGGMDRSSKSIEKNNFAVEDLASALLRLSDGSSIALEITWASHAVDDEDMSFELLGVEGGLRIFVSRYAQQETLSIFGDRGGIPFTLKPEVHVTGGEVSLVVEDFIEAIFSGNWSNHRGVFALHRSEILDACYKSAALGKEVTL